jgi:hypothetical protein
MSRPYRSHKLPACDYCRKRKSRCIVDLPGQGCLACRLLNSDCSVESTVRSVRSLESEPTTENGSTTRHTRTVRKPLQTNSSEETGRDHNDSVIGGSGQVGPSILAPSSENTAHIVGPASASDAHVLQTFLSPNGLGGVQSEQARRTYNVYSDDVEFPVLSQQVPRGRILLSKSNPFSFRPLDILDQLISVHNLELLYL